MELAGTRPGATEHPRPLRPLPWLLFLSFRLLLVLLPSPAASQLRYSVPEEQSPGALVGNVARALGLELRRLGPGCLRINHLGAPSPRYLELDLTNGALFVNERIDREALCEQRPRCLLSLEVLAHNPVAVSSIQVEILDINDNSPRFPRPDYQLQVSESVAPGARFHIESAQDPDVGANSVQTYELSPSEHFELDLKPLQENSKVLELVLRKGLDREQAALHHLVLTAVDGGIPARSGTAQISVRVLDTNDNSPAFDQSTYRVQLREDAPPGTLVVKLNASDPDEGSNGELRYSLSSYTSDRERQLFSIDAVTGEVRVSGTLDYEESSSYQIYVQATDRGPVPMAGHCKVLVDILDVNDNAPEVVLTDLYSPVPEDVALNTVVALLSVNDQDSGSNRKVSLGLEATLPFRLNGFGNSYTLVVSGPLDRERVAAYNITVTATDGGTPPLTSQKTLQIEISDINDNPPSFLKDSYSIYVQENNLPGVLLCTVQATDPDQKENAEVTYSLLDREIQGLPVTSYVSINSASGSLYAVNSFDYEKFREFFVTVEAQDKGRPPLSSTVTANVYVVDVNDHAPHILYPTSTNSSAAIEMVPRTAPAGYLVTKVIAMDSDSGQNAWLFYHLVPTSDSDLFKVELHTGEIRITRKIGDESGTTFNLTVVVRDNGEPPLSATVAITVAVVDRVSKMLPDTQRHIKSARTYSEITLYLIIALSTVSFIFLLTIIVLSIIKCYRYTAYGTACCGGFCGVRERCPAELYKQANNNIDARIPHGLKVQPHFIEVRGNGSLTKTYCYKACLTAGSGSDTFMFYNTGAQTGPGPGGAQASVTDNRHLTGQSGQRQSTGNLIILKNEAVSQNEPRQPNPDWRYSASLRAGMHSSVHLEEAGILRAGPGGPDQQWPTVSSATPEPEAGEVSPPVGAGVNSNSWTFKYGPGNPKQSGPGELPDKFIIPGSPAIISIRQEPANNQIDKSDFITFGKKEETKKKKKKKKGNKAQEKKEKGNSTTDNSDQ
ncbi:protocadherin alpha-C2 isoform X1 [Microtus oregoni]|uniref:protocadherin alpha-C2 isoform X1 n=1 Tax=Microtus oregoni TaxID=111838 RepID=UPI001BB1DB20|nr:protocadherin alpha-C2 isoform X1 [Microtus oregoni]XP_041516104.1 protocadherin alpha-C2 isoform X1 [Microtus oregoni]